MRWGMLSNTLLPPFMPKTLSTLDYSFGFPMLPNPPTTKSAIHYLSWLPVTYQADIVQGVYWFGFDFVKIWLMVEAKETFSWMGMAQDRTGQIWLYRLPQPRHQALVFGWCLSTNVNLKIIKEYNHDQAGTKKVVLKLYIFLCQGSLSIYFSLFLGEKLMRMILPKIQCS